VWWTRDAHCTRTPCLACWLVVRGQLESRHRRSIRRAIHETGDNGTSMKTDVLGNTCGGPLCPASVATSSEWWKVSESRVRFGRRGAFSATRQSLVGEYTHTHTIYYARRLSRKCDELCPPWMLPRPSSIQHLHCRTSETMGPSGPTSSSPTTPTWPSAKSSLPACAIRTEATEGNCRSGYCRLIRPVLWWQP